MPTDDRHGQSAGPAAADRPARVVAGVLGLVFVLIQLWTVDYGTRINDVEAIRRYSFTPGAGAGMEERQATQDAVVSRRRAIDESVEKKMLRFKLYNVNPDEHLPILALRRIRPGRLDFDPDLFLYGGTFLYPLGLWYYALAQAGVIEVASLDALLGSENGLDRVYVAGRIFVLMAFVLSAWVLFRTFRLVTAPWTATWAVGIYLFAPGSILYSVSIKPHWYWLLWICATLFVLTRGWVRGRFALRDEVMLGIFIGLTVGSAPLNFIPALLAGAAILVAIAQGVMRPPALVRVPLVAALCAFLSSPYFFLGWRRLIAEIETTGMMPAAATDPAKIWAFLSSSLPLGFGFALVVVVAGLGLYRLIARKGPMTWYAAACLLGVAVVIGYATADRQSPPVIFFRFVSYLLPIALLMVVHRPWPYRPQVLALVFALTVAQSVPTIIAQIDADDPVRGTRLAAASWVEARVPPGASLCPLRGRVGPGNMPPVDYSRYPASGANCDYIVRRSISQEISTAVPGYRVAAEFPPRLWQRPVAVVYGFANPYFVIYERIETPESQ